MYDEVDKLEIIISKIEALAEERNRYKEALELLAFGTNMQVDRAEFKDACPITARAYINHLKFLEGIVIKALGYEDETENNKTEFVPLGSGS